MSDFRNREDLMSLYWLEFLQYIKDFNAVKPEYDKDPSEENFWRWYIEYKLEADE